MMSESDVDFDANAALEFFDAHFTKRDDDNKGRAFDMIFDCMDIAVDNGIVTYEKLFDVWKVCMFQKSKPEKKERYKLVYQFFSHDKEKTITSFVVGIFGLDGPPEMNNKFPIRQFGKVREYLEMNTDDGEYSKNYVFGTVVLKSIAPEVAEKFYDFYVRPLDLQFEHAYFKWQERDLQWEGMLQKIMTDENNDFLLIHGGVGIGKTFYFFTLAKLTFQAWSKGSMKLDPRKPFVICIPANTYKNIKGEYDGNGGRKGFCEKWKKEGIVNQMDFCLPKDELPDMSPKGRAMISKPTILFATYSKLRELMSRWCGWNSVRALCSDELPLDEMWAKRQIDHKDHRCIFFADNDDLRKEVFSSYWKRKFEKSFVWASKKMEDHASIFYNLDSKGHESRALSGLVYDESHMANGATVVHKVCVVLALNAPVKVCASGLVVSNGSVCDVVKHLEYSTMSYKYIDGKTFQKYFADDTKNEKMNYLKKNYLNDCMIIPDIGDAFSEEKLPRTLSLTMCNMEMSTLLQKRISTIAKEMQKAVVNGAKEANKVDFKIIAEIMGFFVTLSMIDATSGAYLCGTELTHKFSRSHRELAQSCVGCVSSNHAKYTIGVKAEDIMKLKNVEEGTSEDILTMFNAGCKCWRCNKETNCKAHDKENKERCDCKKCVLLPDHPLKNTCKNRVGCVLKHYRCEGCMKTESLNGGECSLCEYTMNFFGLNSEEYMLLVKSGSDPAPKVASAYKMYTDKIASLPKVFASLEAIKKHACGLDKQTAGGCIVMSQYHMPLDLVDIAMRSNHLRADQEFKCINDLFLDEAQKTNDGPIDTRIEFIDGVVSKDDKLVWYARYDGATTISQRDIIEQMIIKKVIRVLLCNVVCGGTGVNFQTLNAVVINDQFWNHGYVRQAFGRVWRLGQVNRAYLYMLMSNGPFNTGSMDDIKAKRSEDKAFRSAKLLNKDILASANESTMKTFHAILEALKPGGKLEKYAMKDNGSLHQLVTLCYKDKTINTAIVRKDILELEKTKMEKDHLAQKKNKGKGGRKRKAPSIDDGEGVDISDLPAWKKKKS